MKQVLIFIAFLSILGTASSVGVGTTTTYFGKRAGSGPFNPCKGATRRPCAVVQQMYETCLAGGTNVTETITLFEEDGSIHSVTTNTYLVNKTADQTMEEFTKKHEENDGQVEVEKEN